MRRHSFTLLELILATGLLLLLAGVSGIAIANTQKSFERMVECDRRMRRVLALDRIADSALRNAIPFHWTDRNSKKVLCLRGEFDSLLVTYLHRADSFSDGALCFLLLELRNNQLIARYSKTPFLPEEEPELYEEELIADQVKSLRFCYGFYRDNLLIWDETTQQKQKASFPAAIQMEVTFADGYRQIWLRRTGGNEEFRRLRTGEENEP